MRHGTLGRCVGSRSKMHRIGCEGGYPGFATNVANAAIATRGERKMTFCHADRAGYGLLE